MKILSFIGNFAERISIIIGAFLGSQIPFFMHQYGEQLAGHVAELQELVDRLRTLAAHSNKTLEQYIHKFTLSADPDFFHQGEFMDLMLYRLEKLHLALIHLTESSPWVRPFTFIQDFQGDIARATLATFQPGIPLSLEGLGYLIPGSVIGWLISRSFFKILSFCLKGFKKIINRQPSKSPSSIL